MCSSDLYSCWLVPWKLITELGTQTMRKMVTRTKSSLHGTGKGKNLKCNHTDNLEDVESDSIRTIRTRFHSRSSFDSSYPEEEFPDYSPVPAISEFDTSQFNMSAHPNYRPFSRSRLSAQYFSYCFSGDTHIDKYFDETQRRSSKYKLPRAKLIVPTHSYGTSPTSTGSGSGASSSASDRSHNGHSRTQVGSTSGSSCQIGRASCRERV